MVRVLEGVRSLDETLKACPTCWMCRNICPVGNLTGREVDTARGFALIAGSVLRGELEPTDDVVELLDRCVDCRQCTNWCVSGYMPWHAVHLARARLAERGVTQRGAPPARRSEADVAGEIVLFVSEAPSGLEAAALNLLHLAQPDAVVLHGDTGYLSWVLGQPSDAKARLTNTLGAVERSGCRTLVTLSPTDARTLLNPPSELETTVPSSIRVIELVDFLVEQGVEGRRDVGPMTAAYHDACSAPRGTGRESRVRQLLKTVPNLTLMEMPWGGDRAQACGEGGGLPRTRPDLAGQLAQARLIEARDAGAEAIVVDAPECAAHLADHAAQVGIRVTSLFELLAEDAK
jgi:Fe-S oxidoreductase